MKLVVSKGTEKTTVPKVVGKTKDEATDMIEEAKLKIEVTEEKNEKVEEGVVIRQDPKANTEMDAGSTVKVYVSIGRGIKQVNVTDVVGQSESTAKETLEGLGFTVKVKYVDATSDDGKIVKQSVEGGKQADEGSTITLTVNKVAQTVSLDVYIKVKDITGGYTKSDNTTTGTTSGAEKVKIKVNDEIRDGVSKNESNYKVELSGKEGEKRTIKVIITDPEKGDIYSSTKDVTFGSTNSVTFSK